MYALKPVFDLDAKVEVPTCVYSLPIIQVSQPIAGVGHYSNKQAAPSTPAALEALSARQDAILSRLGQLKNQVSAYKQSIGLPASISTPPQQHPPVGSSPLLLQLARLKETLARVELMFSRPTSSSKQSSKQEDRQLDVSRTADLVIRCSPSSPPLSLPVVCSLLSRAGLSVFTSCHTHSSVSTPLATGLATLLPPGQVARTAARVRITLIWSEVGRDCELMVSPLTQTTIKGEVNMLRYLARLFPNILAYETNRKVQQVDSLLDSVASLVWAVPKARLPLLRSMTSGLTKGGYLAGSELTVADLALYSTLQTMGMDKEMQPDLLNWFKGMGASFGGTKKESKSGKKDAVKQTKSPGKNAESTGDKIKIEKSPAKKSGKFTSKKKDRSQSDCSNSSSDAVGSRFSKQWPEIKHIFQSHSLADYIDERSIGFVAEKIDGSNIAVTSKGIVASRRNVLLNNPTEEESKKFKFSGVTLEKCVGLLGKLGKLNEYFEKLYPFLNIETVLYGELIQKGTATSKEDKYKYRLKGYNEGDLLLFGGGIAFEENLSTRQIEIAITHLRNKGYHAIVKESEEAGLTHIVLLMNETFETALRSHGFDNIVEHNRVTLKNLVKKFLPQIMKNKIEGIVVNFGTEIVKWKGMDESYPDIFLEQIVQLRNKLDEDIYFAFESVALEARRLRLEENKLRRVNIRLEIAYKSALSKMRSLGELFESCGSKEKEKIVGKFESDLVTEMMKDCHNDEDFKDNLLTFIKSKIF